MPDLAAFSFYEMLPFILIGFAAQLVDGAIGMAFGVISATLLVSFGVPPALASAGVHTVEVFTTGASGLSHILHRNVDIRLFLRLVLPGVIGGITGAYVLTQTPAELARPFVMAYLAAIGLYLLWRGITFPPKPREPRVVAPLGLIGGFLDASGGGGWGPIVTSNLVVQGASPRMAVGTAATAEFFLTLTISASFIFALGFATLTPATAGLLLGGLAAAPVGARVARRTKPKYLLLLIGVILTLTSLYGVATARW